VVKEGAALVDQGDVLAALATVHDPEIPVLSIVDLGLVAEVTVDGGRVSVDLMPTFAACPALHVIRQEVERRLRDLPGVEAVAVRFVLEPVWTVDRISPEGRERLRSFGIAFPGEAAPPCPYCGSTATRRESAFGPTLCRQVYYCDGCRQPFEALKAVGRMGGGS
jgi:ring-1,2-phenylacetyl-CoA epoxidase subunit PaaD